MNSHISSAMTQQEEKYTPKKHDDLPGISLIFIDTCHLYHYMPDHTLPALDHTLLDTHRELVLLICHVHIVYPQRNLHPDPYESNVRQAWYHQYISCSPTHLDECNIRQSRSHKVSF